MDIILENGQPRPAVGNVVIICGNEDNVGLAGQVSYDEGKPENTEKYFKLWRTNQARKFMYNTEVFSA